MALTDDEKQELLNAIKDESNSVDELTEVDSLDNVKSLPAMRGTELVSAPISLLRKPAEEAAATANSAATKAKEAASKANNAATEANTATENANSATTAANNAATSAKEAAVAANNAASSYKSTAEVARDGATARFDAIVETDVTAIDGSAASYTSIVYLAKSGIFAAVNGTSYYKSWDGVDMYMSSDLSAVLKDKAFLCGSSLYVWSDEENSLAEISGSGGGNVINVTEAWPLSSGYYTLETAVAAVEEKQRALGRCITYETAQGKWETKQFIGTSLDNWTSTAAWEDFGGAGTVKSITVNGTKQSPDDDGNVSIVFNETEVDESLDNSSTNPVQNKAIATKLAEQEANTVFGMSAEVSDDESTVRLALTNKSGAEITSVDIPAGSGGSGETTTTKIVLNASVSAAIQKYGDSNTLTWYFDHQYSSGDDKGTSTGQKATVTIQALRGSTTAYSETLTEVSAGSYTLDLSKYLLVGTTDIYVRATTTDPTTGKTQTKQAYVSVKVVTLTLTSSYNVSAGIVSGGYSASETLTIPFAVSGTGTKIVTLYLDGVQNQAKTVTRSGTTNDSFSVAMSSLTAGRHTIQMIAEMEASDELTLQSESIYADFYRSGKSTPLIGAMITFADGRIFGSSDHLTPNIEVGQYEKLTFDFAVYDPDTTPASMSVVRDGETVQTMSVARSTQTFTNRYTSQGSVSMKFVCGVTEYPFNIDVTDSGVEVSEATYGLLASLDASGRSNEEAESDRAKWESNGIETSFEGMDWSSNGWTGESLKLTNGAKAVIGYQPFASDAKSTGLTIEITMKISQVSEREAAVVSCIDNGKGLLITTDDASFKTGETVTYTNEDDEQVTRDVKLGTNYVADKWMKIALIVWPNSGYRLMELYVNGNRTGADLYDASFSFQQDTAQNITIQSDSADVEVKKIRIYNRPLTDDEELENHIVDSDDSDEMMELYDENDILGENGVDIDKLRAKGKGVMRIVRANKLDDVYAENNKKTDFQADIYFYSPFGEAYNFILKNCNIRIQGTSSTKYPSKNIRIYFAKGGDSLYFEVNGVENPNGKNKYQMRSGAIPMNLFTMKSDYSDSSMALNTGGAKLFNDVMKELGLLTPPQQYQYEQGGSVLSAINVRTAIDGFPIDIFCAETADGESEYYGQYNFNNEKSKSGTLFGMEGIDGFEPECPLTFEMLNNTAKACLFQSDDDDDLLENFDAGCEANYPEDLTVADGTYSEAQLTAVKRLYGWIRDCVADAESTNGKTASSDDLDTFVTSKFANEIDSYFDKDFLLAYYLWTDYFLSVDQRAKNMMLRTWDGKIWYLTYYDGDTQLGKRNDCFLVYTYNTMRDTYDAEAGKYAFEGRDSWLWNLVLANLGDDLKTMAARLREVLTNDRVLSMMNDEQSGNWSDRAYNKSGELKYIKPAEEEMYGKVWPFIYALQGSNAAHREFFIKNRFALLDAKYGTSNFTSDNIDLYLSRSESDADDEVVITANEEYAFGYGTNNKANIANSGLIAEGEEATLSIGGAYTVNDPLRIYGASKMRALDMTGAADHLKNGFDLGKCPVLRELNMQSSGTGSTGWWLVLSACKQLRTLNVRNQSQAKTGSSTSTELDLSEQKKLETLDARGTQVKSVTFAKGAPLTKAYLPATLTVLRLEYLNQLTMSGLSLAGWTSVTTLIFDSCQNLNWETLLAKCTKCERVRITGIDREDDGTWLKTMSAYKGVDASGNNIDTCALVGKVQLTSYMDEDELEELKAKFSGELNILQPAYSMIEFDDSVSDDANVSNLDNNTGYKYGNDYVPSGHIAKILSLRHRCLGKQAVEGTMTIFPLHDDNSNYFADASEVTKCTAASLDGTQGDVFMYEPHYWFKGINDYLNSKKYSCYSSNKEMPDTPEADVLTLDEIKDGSGYKKSYKIVVGSDTLAESYTSDTKYGVCRVAVSGYKKVRFPSVPGTSQVGSVFTDDDGNVISSICVATLSLKFTAGMYIIADVPDGAAYLNFSILVAAEFDKVVLSNSDKIEDMEPDWVEHEACLTAVFMSSTVDTKLRSCITGGSSTASLSWTDFNYYSAQRKLQQIDYEMHRDIANLFFAKYGRRDSQSQCGAGSHSNTRTTGGTAIIGMQDTVNTNGTTTGGVESNGLAYYKKVEDGETVYTKINNTNCLGYEDVYGHKHEMMDNVGVNVSSVDRKWVITMPDGTQRKVDGVSSAMWPAGMVHGKYMDVIPAGTLAGSSSTYYCDYANYSDSKSRVVYRSSSHANADGGVSYSYANSGASNSYAIVGSRLAFRGKIDEADSVEAFLALTEIA